MITKDQLVASMLHECDIIEHLYSKLPHGSLDYRPSEKQRSTLELLRYVAMCGIGGIRSLNEGNWRIFNEYAKDLERMSPDGFPAALKRQREEIRAFFESVTEDDLRTREAKLPAGAIQPLGTALINGPLKWLSAYKLQLFLYAKASGARDIGTSNAWAGVDWKKSG
jgi:hypothetical protein